ncbi:MAG: tetratricopeptide repeat protein [Candidatus Neomarinimicrobiota bacterium]
MTSDDVQRMVTTAYDLLEQGEVDRAKQLFTNVVDSDENKKARLGIALCAYARKDYMLSLMQLQNLVEDDPDYAEVYNLCGLISRDMGDLVGARGFFILAIEKSPVLVEAQFNYGNILLDLEDYDNGVAVLVKILEQHPEHVPTLVRMSELYFEIGKHESALLYLGQALKYNPANAAALKIFDNLQTSIELTDSIILGSL